MRKDYRIRTTCRSLEMLTLEQFYLVLSAVFPLYVALFLGYGSVRWWNIVTADQSRGLNRFTSYIVVPALLFQILAFNNPYTMDLRLIAAYSLAGTLILGVLCGWAWFAESGSIDWVITLLQLAVVPNTIIVGIPVLSPLYTGATQGIAAIFIGQVLWINVFLLLYETRKVLLDMSGTKAEPLVSEDVSNVAGSTADAVVAGISSGREAQSRSSFTLSTDSSLPQCQGLSGEGKVDEEKGDDCQVTIGPSGAEKDPNVFSETRAQAQNSRGTSVTVGEAQLSGDTKLISNGQIQASETESALERGREYMEVKKNIPMQVAVKVMKKMLQLPMTYASFLGVIYSLIANRWGFSFPLILKNSLDIFSRMGVGLVLYTIGLFMAGEKTLISCGIWLTLYGSFWRFVIGPTAMGLTSLLIGFRGNALRFAIAQATLPQGVICFVFAKEYNLHASIFSTAVSFQTIVFLPIVLAYYVVLELL